MAVIGPVDCKPLGFLEPDHAPEAEQAVALVADQLRVEEPPELTLLGLACSATSGAAAITVTVIPCDVEPPGPVHVSSNSVVFVSCPVTQVPLIAIGPCQPPLAMHWVALTAFHDNVDSARLLIVVGEAVSVMVGAGSRFQVIGRVWAIVPPGPVHVRVKALADVLGAKVALPLVGWAPLHPPDAAQLWAWLAFHCKVTF